MNKYLKILLLVLPAIIEFNSIAQEIIPLKKEPSGVYTVPCQVNGLNLRFILDTGASSVSISLTEATFMLKNGYLSDDDIQGITNTQTATGEISENYVVNLKSIKIGSVTLNNVKAVVSQGLNAPLLLGQTVLEELGNWSISDKNLILNDYTIDYEFSSYEEMTSYCRSLLAQYRRKEALSIIKDYGKAGNVRAKAFYLNLWKESDGDNSFINQCINDIKSYNFTDYNLKYECFNSLAVLYRFALHSPIESDKIYESFARNKEYPEKIRRDAYVTLYLYNMDSSPLKANSYAKEAIEDGIYDLASWYCDYCLLENHEYTKAYEILKEGYSKGNIVCSFHLGQGFLQDIWPTKSITKGLTILDNLAQTCQYPDAIFALCDYYWGKAAFSDMQKYAKMFDEEHRDYRNVYEAISYYNLNDYRMAKNILDNTNPSYIRSRIDLLGQYYSLLGDMYSNGKGYGLDFNKAFDCFTELAKIDAGWGYSCLGDLHINKLLQERDYETAFKYYTLGANNGDGYSYLQLAILHKYGLGTYQSESLYRSYKRKAEELGMDTSHLSE